MMHAPQPSLALGRHFDRQGTGSLEVTGSEGLSKVPRIAILEEPGIQNGFVWPQELESGLQCILLVQVFSIANMASKHPPGSSP